MAKAAILVFHQRYIYADGALREMVLWRLPQRTGHRPHGFKYRLYYGSAQGQPLVRYDNELGKGDHRHLQGREEPYRFSTVSALVRDFMADIARLRSPRT